MKKILFIIFILSSLTASAQRISLRFNNVAMPEALRQINKMTNRYTINFIFNDLEDFRVTADVNNKTVPDAILQLIGYYPIGMTMVSDSIISVECYQKAERRYKGRIVDENGNSAEFANIALLSLTDSSLLAGGVSNQSGYFVIPCKAKNVIVRVSSVGYKTIYKAVSATDLGIIRLQPEMTTIKGVVVNGRIVRKSATAETYIINDSLRKGCVNALQLFNKLHGITVDPATDNVKIGVNTNVPLVLDGRDVGMEYIRSLNPERIKKIEVLRYPKGKYGDAPIVMNIITRSDYVGWDAGANTNLAYSPRNGNTNREIAGGNFTMSLGKISTYVFMDLTHRDIKEAKAYEYKLNDSEEKTIEENPKHPNISDLSNTANVSVGADWRFSQSQTLSLQSWLKASHDNKHEGYKLVPDGQSSVSKDHYDAVNSTTGLFYRGILPKSLNLSGQLTYTTYNIDETRHFIEDDDNSIVKTDGNRQQWNFNAEMSKAWKKLRTTVGTNIDYRRYVNKNPVTTLTRYTYRENRYEGYLRLNYNPMDNLSIAVGGNLLNIVSRNDDTRKSETSVMPNFKLFYEVLPWLQLSGDYFCDIEYPNLDQLSPVAYSVNRYLSNLGNPDLKARIMHYMEWRIDIKNIGEITYMLKRSHNEITPWYYTDNGMAYETLTNGKYHHQYIGFNGDYQLPHDFRFDIVANYQWYKRYNNETSGNRGRTWYLDAELFWTGVKNLTLHGEYFLRHDKLPLLQGKEYNQQEVLTLSATQRLLKGKLQLTLAGYVPVKAISKRTYAKINIPNYSQTTWNNAKVSNCMLLFSARINLGNNKARKSDNSINETQEKKY